jgi:hypothetical protein
MRMLSTIMEAKLNCNGLWWTPGSQKIFGNLTLDDNDGPGSVINGPEIYSLYLVTSCFTIVLLFQHFLGIM